MPSFLSFSYLTGGASKPKEGPKYATVQQNERGNGGLPDPIAFFSSRACTAILICNIILLLVCIGVWLNLERKHNDCSLDDAAPASPSLALTFPSSLPQDEGCSNEQRTQAQSWKYDKKEFCYEGHLMPSIIGIGIQKCGTSTLDGLMGTNFKRLTHGGMKEHHFFDHWLESEFYSATKGKKYWKSFPDCVDEGVYRTMDITPNYTNPNAPSPEGIREYYDSLGLPTEKIIFLVMVCDPAHRIQSAYYFMPPRYHIGDNYNTMNHYFPFNEWFDYVTSMEPPDDQNGIFTRGRYDEIMERYFTTFPKNKFFIINNEYAFRNETGLVDELANLLEEKLPKKEEQVTKNVGKKDKEPITEKNQEYIKSMYEERIAGFRNIIKCAGENVILFPDKEKFLRSKWIGGEGIP